MPYSPRPSISFPAFQTPAGLLPQADREHRSDYSETQGQARELNRRIFENYQSDAWLRDTITRRANIELMLIDPYPWAAPLEELRLK